MADVDRSNLTTLTVDLLSAYVANNSIEHGDLAGLIRSTHAALSAIEAPEPPASAEPEHKPAVGIRKSLSSRTHILSMIDGKPYQTLKRHLAKHGLTPADYRERYALPRDYPMVAPAYSESRRAIAERLGLGRKVGKAQPSEVPAIDAEKPAIETPAEVPTTAPPARSKASKAPTVAAPKEAAKAPRKAAAISTATGAAKTAAPAVRGRKAATAPSAENVAPKPAPRKRSSKPAKGSGSAS